MSPAPTSTFIDESRAQTLIGFVALAGAFVVAIALVFGFVGGLGPGGTVNAADTTEQASLTATELATDVLSPTNSTADGQPHTLSHTQVVRFFDDGTDPSPATLAASEDVNIRVTLEHTGGLTPPPAFEGNTTLTVGDTPPTPDVVATQTTQATLDGKNVALTVETWP